MSNKILYSPTEGTSGFFYNGVEIVNPEDAGFHVSEITGLVTHRPKKSSRILNPVKPGDIFDLPEGTTVEIDEICGKGSCIHSGMCYAEGLEFETCAAIKKATIHLPNKEESKPDFTERYKKIAESDSFKQAYKDRSIGDVMKVEPDNSAHIVGWEVTTNENGVVMATLNRDILVKYIAEFEQLKKDKAELLEGLKQSFQYTNLSDQKEFQELIHKHTKP